MGWPGCGQWALVALTLASSSRSQVQTRAAGAAACLAWDKLSVDVRGRLLRSVAAVTQLVTRNPAAESYSATE